jgi:hypothetical protein
MLPPVIDRTKTVYWIVLMITAVFGSVPAYSMSPEREEAASESKTAQWYTENWPASGSLGEFRKMKDGSYLWKNAKGDIVGEIDIKGGRALQGIAYVQGAADFRYVARYEEGKPTLLASFLLKEGKWVIFQDNQGGEQASAGQPATRPKSDSEGDHKPQPESEGRSR